MRITFKNATVLNAQAFGRESSLSNKDFAVENFAARDLGVQDAVACDFQADSFGVIYHCFADYDCRHLPCDYGFKSITVFI